jgi:hypothetical protein
VAWKQATSYCDTAFGLTEFCGCEPAYMLVAMLLNPFVLKPAGTSAPVAKKS